MKTFPERLREVWNKWELRVLVLLSLSWQIFLIIFGSRRRYVRTSIISFFVWVTYLSADWLATVSLGTLANSQGDQSDEDDRNRVLKALWAPFLLVHLGGPDTITAYSLEDNSLWLRHFLGLIVQAAVAIYIFVRSLTNTAITFIAIPVFVSGFIKYSERTWVLRSSSPETFEDSLLSASTQQDPNLNKVNNVPELNSVHKAYSLFSMLKRLYADLSLRFGEGERGYSSLTSNDAIDDEESSNYAFKLVEIQLGFLYDVLYTKATIIYSLTGLVFRFISLISVLSAFVAYITVIDKDAYSKIDFYITFALFIGAVFLEIYAFISLIFSDWTRRWLTKNHTRLPKLFSFIYSAVSYCESRLRFLPCLRKKRWSESISQHNLVDFCLKNRVTRCLGPEILYNIHFTLELYRQRKWKSADDGLKAVIFQQLLKKYDLYRNSGFDSDVLKKLLNHRLYYVLEEKNMCDETIRWSLEVEFDHSLLIWHIATDICFESEPEKLDDRNCKVSKRLSDYMLYILLMRPNMLPKWIDRSLHVRDTFKEAIGIFHRRQFPVKSRAEAYRMMLQLQAQCQPLELHRREKSSRSVFLEGCRLGAQLLQLKYPWEMICQVWIEMVTYAASHCEWVAHGQQLRRGGELLTHVCLLMAELRLSDQFELGRQSNAAEAKDVVGWGWMRSTMSP
ncbi:hypothetical protein L6164_003703 [Bauhinia variegata]|uniref:Uncharacterized protein n=1 Tax=Bauhinia variegata TaxID=167791 RepID=A0ACB9Q247_BAUVA|nr:hypothetical protein L6164_003703 [Bauhinia variegata]